MKDEKLILSLNTLIAIFDGGEEAKENGLIYFDHSKTNKAHAGHGENGVDLQYNKSWDWFMPAWKKFRTLTALPVTQYEVWCHTIENWIVRSDIEQAFIALAGAIEWYNSI